LANNTFGQAGIKQIDRLVLGTSIFRTCAVALAQLHKFRKCIRTQILRQFRQQHLIYPSRKYPQNNGAAGTPPDVATQYPATTAEISLARKKIGRAT
jgi:hypothetical protein